MTDSELDTVLNEVIKQMLGEISTSEIKAEKHRIAEEKRRMEEARYVNDLCSYTTEVFAVYVKVLFNVFDVRRREAFLEQFSGELCAKISEEVLTESIRETSKAEIRYLKLSISYNLFCKMCCPKENELNCCHMNRSLKGQFT